MATNNNNLPHTYITNFQEASSANVCATGNLISQKELHVVVGKINRLELHKVDGEDLQQLTEISLYEKIEIMKLFPSKNNDKDFIFIVTAKYNAMILECIQKNDKIEIITKAYSCILVENAKKTRYLCSINLKSRIIGLQLFLGIFIVVPMDQDHEGELKTCSLRAERKQIRCFEFLYGRINPTVIMITESNNSSTNKHGLIQVKQLYMNDRLLEEVSDTIESVSPTTKIIIPISRPPFGAIIIGNESIIYHNGYSTNKVYPNQIIFNVKCYASITNKFKGVKYLLGDENGHLFKLYLKYEFGQNHVLYIAKIKIIFLGNISIPSSISYIYENLAYVASQFGDSQFIKFLLTSNKSAIEGSQIRVLKTYTNLGPIVNMCMADTEQQGQDDIFTCSGAFKHGSIKRIRSEIGIFELASIDLAGIKKIWSLNLNNNHNFDDALVLSFIEHSKVLSFKHEDVEEIRFDGLETNLETLYCGNTKTNKIVQITSASVRLLCWATEQLIDEWTPPDCKKIDVAACNGQKVICAIANCLYYIKIKSEKVVENGSIKLKQEVSCLDICSFKNKYNKSVTFFVVGLWVDICVKLFQVPQFAETANVVLNEIFIPRSLCLVTLENTHYLFCSMGDSTLYSFYFYPENGTLCEIRKNKFGNRPTLLQKFQSHSTTNIMMCLDNNSIIINSYGDKLIFSKANMNKVSNLCSLNTYIYPNSLAMVTKTSLIIGTIDKLKKLNVHTIPLGDSPKGIVYQEASKSFGVITVKTNVQSQEYDSKPTFSASSSATNISSALQNYRNKYAIQTQHFSDKRLKIFFGTKYHYPYFNVNFNVNHMIILHQNTFEVLHAYQLFDYECALHIISTKLENDPATYYILGTGFSVAGNNKLGRVIVFHYDNSLSKLTQVDEKELNGVCNCLIEFKGKLLISVNNSVQLLGWNSSQLRFDLVYLYNNIFRFVEPKQSFIHFGDSYLIYGQYENKLIKDETNLEIRQFSSTEIINENFFIIADDSYIYTFKRDRNSPVTSRQRIQIGRFNMDDSLTVFKHGSLTNENFVDTHNSLVSTEGNVFFGTYNGTLGIVTQINPEIAQFLYDLQKNLVKRIKEKTKYTDWLNNIVTRNGNIQGYLDGNLIETFLNYPITEMSIIYRGLEGSYDRQFRTILTETEIGIEDIIKFIKQLKHLPLYSK